MRKNPRLQSCRSQTFRPSMQTWPGMPQDLRRFSRTRSHSRACVPRSSLGDVVLRPSLAQRFGDFLASDKCQHQRVPRLLPFRVYQGEPCKHQLFRLIVHRYARRTRSHFADKSRRKGRKPAKAANGIYHRAQGLMQIRKRSGRSVTRAGWLERAKPPRRNPNGEVSQLFVSSILD